MYGLVVSYFRLQYIFYYDMSIKKISQIKINNLLKCTMFFYVQVSRHPIC
jgi:hypothetical protein